ncbi:carbamoyltransferase [Photorhabdus bodei]|uniref:Carbamoyl transferase n=1 Tax=Photorhabdus bodei TaxID=2029681 RepID=A0ABX0ALH9_9GAMM|nr:carbamoyltransferase C-terminal domain-containing protein [Photorhabdus bodei]NDK98521.1 carbamoyl transferase [Photorhabdus bodei]NDL02773.1 carbamoyl transferase [Photorhabdus bodei]NDL06978.1 carbamoyl transferase [Photorhabdus bodei]
MYILGINSVYHESAVCLLKDGETIFAIEEERLNRRKHGKPANIDNPDELPLASIEVALDFAGIRLEDVSHIGFSIDPIERRKSVFIDEVTSEGNWGSVSGESIFYRKTTLVPEILQSMGFRGQFHWVPHHTAHAASAYFVSPFDKALTLSLDGVGEDNTAGVYLGDGNSLKKIKTIEYPNSIGFMWEKLAEFLGFSVYDACKVMGMSAYGKPEGFMPAFQQLVKIYEKGEFTIDNTILNFRSQDFSKLESLFGIVKRVPGGEVAQEYYDIAASLQQITDEIVLNMAHHYLQETATNKLCLAGGVALNCITNKRLYEELDIEDIFVQPAAHDAGTATGAALFIWHHILENNQRYPLTHTYWGLEYSEDDYQRSLKAHGLDWTYEENIHEVVAGLLAENNVVGWFQGRMEFGPRALGNRSLLADPRNKDIRDLMNRKVKHREMFRPFAPSVLRQHVADWFHVRKELPEAAKYMLLAMDAKVDKASKIPAVVHEDGTARVQVVDSASNPDYAQLIEAFYRKTGVPLLLNTSYNDSEPIVCSPEDAIKTFMKTNIDYLVLGNYLIKSIH